MATICYSCAALVLLAVLCVPSVYSYSAGAREESCYNMQAVHFNIIANRNESSQNCFLFGACFWSVEVVDKVIFGSGDGGATENITTYECDQVYEVLVTTTSDRVFEGYMLEARATTASGDFEETSTIWGQWQVGPSDPYHTVNCSRSKDSTEIVEGAAATQNEGTQIMSVTLYWRAPPQPENDDDYQNLPESITLWVTIVQAELTYFFPISAPNLERNCTEPPLPSSSPMPTMSPTSSLPASLPSVSFPPISLPPTSLPPTPLPIPPTITQSPEIATFSCTATGSPRPTITWWRVENGLQTQIVAMDGVYYIADQELGVETMSTLIIIIEADVSDTGTYLCLAENEVGTDDAVATEPTSHEIPASGESDDNRSDTFIYAIVIGLLSILSMTLAILLLCTCVIIKKNKAKHYSPAGEELEMERNEAYETNAAAIPTAQNTAYFTNRVDSTRGTGDVVTDGEPQREGREEEYEEPEQPVVYEYIN